jgi:hypothetical protein
MTCSKYDNYFKFNSSQCNWGIYMMTQQVRKYYVHLDNKYNIHVISKYNKESGYNLNLDLLTILYYIMCSCPRRTGLKKF